MAIRIPWDDYEIALMFEVYKKMASGLTLNAAAKELSNQLRQKAQNQGKVIDDIFRNTNGMIFYLKRTEYLFTNGKSGLGGAQKNVVNMFALYQNDPKTYLQILHEAQRLAGLTEDTVLRENSSIVEHYLDNVDTPPYDNQRKDEQDVNDWSKELPDYFAQWLSTRVSPAQLSELYQVNDTLDEFCQSRSILRKPLFETTDITVLNKALTSLDSNKIFKMKYRSGVMLSFLRHYIRFLREKHDDIENLKAAYNEKLEQNQKKDHLNTPQTQNTEPSSTTTTESILRDFKAWMKNDTDSRSVYLYWHAIKNAHDYITEKGLRLSLIRGSSEQVRMTASKLMQDPSFPGFGVDHYLESFERFALFATGRAPEQTEEELTALAHESTPSNVSHSSNTVTISNAEEGLFVAFGQKTDYAYTDPVSMSVFDKQYKPTSWQDAYMLLLTSLADYNKQRFMRLKGQTVSGSTRVLFGDEVMSKRMIRPKLIPGTLLYGEFNFSATNLVRLMGSLLSVFRIDPSHVKIKYRKAEATETPVRLKPEPPKPESPKPIAPTQPVDEQQKAFRNWLEANGMASSSARVYAYAVAESGRYAIEYNISSVELYTVGNAQEASIYIEKLLADAGFAAKNKSRNNQLRAGMRKYVEYLQEHPSASVTPVYPTAPVPQRKPSDPRWKEILEKDFPDGYILNDFLCQFQAAGMWQEHFGEPCPLEGEAIDQAISACGTVKDGHVFVSNEDEGKLLAEIADLVADTLKTYSNIYTSQVYQRYREALVPLSIFTEKVMVQQVMQYAAGRFNFTYSYLFTKPGDSTITEIDCERALRKHGGMMTTEEAADELWFIPRDKVGHYLSVNSEILNLGTGQWMLAEHFPFSREDAEQVAKMLDERFLSQEYILSRDIPDMLQQHLPFIAENVSNLSFAGLFNIIFYYLKDRYGFTRSIVTPAGVKVDFSMLYSAYAREHETFSMDDLDAYSKELHVPIYWESTFAGGAVRVSQDEFVNRSQIQFDVYAIDCALESICSGDYMSFQSVPNGMLVLLPSCGYQWNHYLLQSYVYGFSKVFRMSYSSFAKGGCYGAIVRRDCTTIDSYEKLIEQVLTDDNSWTTQADALNLIVGQGYQAMRKFNGIENIMAKAKQNKLNDGR